MSLPKSTVYTIEDIYALPEGQRAELIDGRLYDLAPPDTVHQRIVMNQSAEIRNYIKRQGGDCEIFPAPFAVFLIKDDKNYIEPDISVICDRSMLDERGCKGAPDWSIEMISPSNPQMDYGIKIFKYRTAGVREYWIVNPQKETVTVFDLENERLSNQYSFNDDIPICIYENFIISLKKLIQ